MLRPNGPAILKSRRSTYELHCGQMLDCAALLTCCRWPQLKQQMSRIFSPETIFDSLSKSDGPLRLATSFASSFSIE